MESPENQRQVFRPSQPSWKSLCDFHIPTASTTTIYMDERNEGRTKQCRIVKKAIGSIPHNCYVRGVLVSARFRLRAPESEWGPLPRQAIEFFGGSGRRYFLRFEKGVRR